MFHVGQKVVCVDASSHERASNLQEGAVYTVTGVTDFYGKPAIRLAEAAHFSGNNLPFWSFRFRPVVEKKTDISVFEEILRRESIDTPEHVS